MILLKRPQCYLSRIPKELRKEYIRIISEENMIKMVIIAAMLAIFEPLIALFLQSLDTIDFYISIGIALYAMACLPILYIVRKNIKRIPVPVYILVQILFLVGVLTAGLILSLHEQSAVASSSSYFLAVFTIAAFITMPPLISLPLFLLFNIIFIIMLPQFQPLQLVINTLNINTLSMTGIAWILNQMISRNRVKSHMNEKLIIEKNNELKKINMELKELTIRDSMTNLLNHKNSLRRLKEEIDRAKRINYPLTVAMIDLDNFKQINDTYGHQIGDTVLIRVAKILTECCRLTDIIGRYGGEEFIVIMPNTNSQEAVALLERIKSRIESTDFVKGVQITGSFGVSELVGDSVHGILRSSDAMLYEAKKKGKNRIEVQLRKDMKSAAIK
ncbi:MAG: GGDEF domain-containing protein [Eubacteriales bacterium]|nr:GGDEF domain-containing protein [Eubacteriales bacterium]